MSWEPIPFTPDSYIVYDFLSAHGIEHDEAFVALKQEMVPYYIPRRELTFKGKQLARDKAFFGVYKQEPKGTQVPFYYYPSDYRPQANSFELVPMLKNIRDAVETEIDGEFPINHCVVNHYLSGQDYIGKHNDKTTSWVWGSKALNVSLGATRTLRLHYEPGEEVGSFPHDLLQWNYRPKDAGSFPQWTYKDIEGIKPGGIDVAMPPGSLFVLGWVTNAYFKHELIKDKKCEGNRFGLTFRSMQQHKPYEAPIKPEDIMY